MSKTWAEKGKTRINFVVNRPEPPTTLNGPLHKLPSKSKVHEIFYLDFHQKSQNQII